MMLLKITFLNDDMTEALLQRGIWWWKRVAVVKRKEQGTKAKRYLGEYRLPVEQDVNWLYIEANIWCEPEVDERIEILRQSYAIWKSPIALPRARTEQRSLHGHTTDATE